MEKVKLSEKFMLTIKEANIYFGIGEKKLRRIAEDNEGSFALFTGNRYLIMGHSEISVTIPVPNSNTIPVAVPTDKNNHYNNE